MNKQTIGAIVAVAVILLGLGVWALNRPTNAPQNTTTNETSKTDTDTTDDTPIDTTESEVTDSTIVFTNNGFEKSTYRVKANEPVTIDNQASFEIEFSSDDHPTHQENPELNMSSIDAGERGTFTPTKTGTWHVHDHEHPEFTATLIVE